MLRSQVNFGEETGPVQAGAPAPGKDLPAWFRQEEGGGGAAAGAAAAAAAAEAAAAEAEQRRLQQEYLRAYLSQQQDGEGGAGRSGKPNGSRPRVAMTLVLRPVA